MSVFCHVLYCIAYVPMSDGGDHSSPIPSMLPPPPPLPLVSLPITPQFDTHGKDRKWLWTVLLPFVDDTLIATQVEGMVEGMCREPTLMDPQLLRMCQEPAGKEELLTRESHPLAKSVDATKRDTLRMARLSKVMCGAGALLAGTSVAAAGRCVVKKKSLDRTSLLLGGSALVAGLAAMVLRRRGGGGGGVGGGGTGLHQRQSNGVGGTVREVVSANTGDGDGEGASGTSSGGSGKAGTKRQSRQNTGAAKAVLVRASYYELPVVEDPLAMITRLCDGVVRPRADVASTYQPKCYPKLTLAKLDT